MGDSKSLLRFGGLDDAADIHDGDAVADMFDDAEVVGYEQVGKAEALLQLQQQVQDLRLYRYIERGNRLVGHDQTGVEGEGTGDADALALAAAEGVGEALQEFGPQSDEPEQLLNALNTLPAVRHSVDEQGFADYIEQGHARVQGGEGVLEDHLHLPAQGLQLVPGQIGDVDHCAVIGAEENLSCGRLQRAHDTAGGGRLAAAALSYDAEGLSSEHAEIQAVNCADLTHGALPEALPNREEFL